MYKKIVKCLSTTSELYFADKIGLSLLEYLLLTEQLYKRPEICYKSEIDMYKNSEKNTMYLLTLL